MALADWITLVDDKLGDTAGIVEPDEVIRAIEEAVAAYSISRQREKLAAITGDGTAYVFALPADYEPGFSAVTKVEYPTGKREPEYLDEADWTVRRQLDGSMKLHFYHLVLPAAVDAHITYRMRHTVDLTEDSVPIADRASVAGLAAAVCCRHLAAYYTQTTDPTISADAVSYRTKGTEYLALAVALEKAYRVHVGIEGGSSVAANVNYDLDVPLLSTTGMSRFYHAGTGR